MADVVYPYKKFRYRLEIDGLEAGGFSEVTGFDASIDAVEYREGDLAPMPMKVQGLRKYGNVTFKWGLTSSRVLHDWLMEGANGPVSRKTVTITLIDESAADCASWQIINAWPCKYTIPDLNETSPEVAIETLELTHEGMTRTL